MIARTNKNTANPRDPDDVPWVSINMTWEEAKQMKTSLRMLEGLSFGSLKSLAGLYDELLRIGV